MVELEKEERSGRAINEFKLVPVQQKEKERNEVVIRPASFL